MHYLKDGWSSSRRFMGPGWFAPLHWYILETSFKENFLSEEHFVILVLTFLVYDLWRCEFKINYMYIVRISNYQFTIYYLHNLLLYYIMVYKKIGYSFVFKIIKTMGGSRKKNRGQGGRGWGMNMFAQGGWERHIFYNFTIEI